MRFYELFAADPVLSCLLDYNDPDVPRDARVHGRRFGLWLLARFPRQHTCFCSYDAPFSPWLVTNIAVSTGTAAMERT